MNIIIIGPQGSGKGTQGRKLAELLGLRTFEMGDVLRQQASQETEQGKKLKEMLAQGVLLEDWVVNEVVKAYLDQSGFNNILFDGHPRRIGQWQYLKTVLTEYNSKVDVAIALDVDDFTCIGRLEHRIMSKNTGEIFNSESNPPPADWPKEDLVVREDDKPESVSRRLALYHEVTQPIIEEYKNDGILMRVDARGHIDEVFALILSSLRTRELI